MNKVLSISILFKIYLHEFLWNIRIYTVFFFSFNKRLNKSIFELKKNGYVIIPNFFDNSLVNKINNECHYLLKNIDKVENIEKISGSIKLKNIGKNSSFLKKIQQNFFLKLLAILYSFKIKLIRNGALLIYSLTHDGKYKFENVEGGFNGKMIAGDPHLDSPTHELKAFIALDDIKLENGPFVSIKSSNHFNYNLISNYIGMRQGVSNSELIDLKYLDQIRKTKNVFYGTVNKGDLVIIDTRSIHYASSLKQGKREMLWFYY